MRATWMTMVSEAARPPLRQHWYRMLAVQGIPRDEVLLHESDLHGYSE